MRDFLLAAGLAGSVFCVQGQAFAMPVASTQAGENAAVTLVAEGCGPGFHRGPAGHCRPNAFVPPRRVCPPGTHLGPMGRECRPNF
jgi:hypothetical protein